jgi:hypothetical protein
MIVNQSPEELDFMIRPKTFKGTVHKLSSRIKVGLGPIHNFVFTADRHLSLFCCQGQLSCAWGGQIALQCSKMHCLKMHFAQQA